MPYKHTVYIYIYIYIYPAIHQLTIQPSIIKQIPQAISNRIPKLSCDTHEFEKTAPTYNYALRSSGFNEPLIFNKNNHRPNRNNRPRNINWFNPPYSASIQTNVGRCFLQLIKKHIPHHMSYTKCLTKTPLTTATCSCMNNITSIIKCHNSKVLKANNSPPW